MIKIFGSSQSKVVYSPNLVKLGRYFDISCLLYCLIIYPIIKYTIFSQYIIISFIQSPYTFYFFLIFLISFSKKIKMINYF